MLVGRLAVGHRALPAAAGEEGERLEDRIVCRGGQRREEHGEEGKPHARLSPRSQSNPVMMRRASRTTGASRCSLGACCEHDAYECGTHTVGSPRVSANTLFGSEPPRLGSTAGFLPVVFSSDAAA